MAQIEYRNRSISQLVSELNHLGEPGVLLSALRLTAIHEKDIPDVKRYKNSQGQQFFIPTNSQKKFAYTDIAQTLSSSQLDPMRELFLRGFNLSVLFSLPREQGRLTQLVSQVGKLVGNCICAAACFSEQGIVDAVAGSKLAERDFEGRLKYYRVMEINLIAFLDKLLRGQPKGAISVIKLRSLQSGSPTPNELNLICLPQEMFSTSLKLNEFLGVCKSQLTQIFNYIKLSPASKYQHFSKVVTKRMPVTNILATLILEHTATIVINWMSQGGPALIHERLSFYDKMRELSVLLKKEEGVLPIIIDLPNDFRLSRQERPIKSAIKASKTDRTPVAAFSEETELDYCRSFQRKTHKYSINDVEPFDQHDSPFDDSSRFRETSHNNTPSPVTHFPPNQKATSREREVGRFDETMPRKPNPESYRETEEIAILKANHAIEISQYHQTIQELNRKILVLSKERDLEELYTIHEREIMLLELKIKELRNDIATLCNSNDEKSYKAIVRKLNEEIKRLESRNSEQKVSNGKTIILQKQISELRAKYEESEKARKKLTFQLESLTKRLKICDSEIEVLTNKDANLKNIQQKNKGENGNALSLNDSQSIKEINMLIKSIQEGSEQSKGFLIRKITNLMTDLSACRNSILECNDFLVQLEEHLEESLGNKEPQIVLDCNRFIRNFLMDNLNVF